jgi:Putative zinc-finger
MKCPKKEKIRAFIDRELTLSETKNVHSHISECSRCRRILQEAEEDIKITRRDLELLNPEVIPECPPLISSQHDRDKDRFPFRKFILTPIRVPAGVLVLIVSLLLGTSSMLLVKNLKEVSLGFSPRAKEKKASLSVFMEGFVQSISLQADAEEIRPIENPRIFVLREALK